MTGKDVSDLLGGLSEAELKIWNQIQAVKKQSNDNPEIARSERLIELRRELYRRTGGSGG